MLAFALEGYQVQRSSGQYDQLIFAIALLLVFLCKLNVLSTPFYWDEMGWVRAAHWLAQKPLYMALPGLHPLGTFFGHPPGLHISMSILFKLFGVSIWISHFFILCFSFLGVYFTYLLGKDRFGMFAGIFAGLFLFFSPIYYAQSAMYLGDVPVAAMGVMSIYFGLKKRYVPYLIASTYLVFIKESGAAIILAFLCFLLYNEFRRDRRFYFQIFQYSIPLLMVTIFLISQKVTAGKFVGIYSFEFDIYKHTVSQMYADFVDILKWIFVHQHRYILTAMIVLFVVLRTKRALRKEWILISLIFTLAVLPFTYFMLLPRYLIPFLPYLCIAAAWALSELISSIKIKAATGAAITIVFISSLTGPPSHGNQEWNMNYVRMVRMYQSMCAYTAREFPHASILTTFPYEAALRRPFLGYVTKPLKVVPLHKGMAKNDCDLILISEPDSPGSAPLMKFVQEDGMVLIKRTREAGMISELYQKQTIEKQARMDEGPGVDKIRY